MSFLASSSKYIYPTVALLVCTVLIPAAASAQSGNYKVEEQSGGGVMISFPSNCKIMYDANANRGGHSGGCSAFEYGIADRAAASYLTGGNNTAQQGVSESMMQRYCQGEASSSLNVRPTEISTQPVQRINGGRFSVQGQTPQSGYNVTRFECTYDRNGVFEQVLVTSRPGGQSNNNQHGSASIPAAARSRCVSMFGGGSSSRVTKVSALRPGYWEVMMEDDTNKRAVACTVSSDGEIQDWVELN